MGKIKIPKNRDIEEMVEQQEKQDTVNMETVIAQIDNKKQQFKDKINIDKQQNKKLKNVYARKDAQAAEEKRRIELLKALNKLDENREEEQR